MHSVYMHALTPIATLNKSLDKTYKEIFKNLDSNSLKSIDS